MKLWILLDRPLKNQQKRIKLAFRDSGLQIGKQSIDHRTANIHMPNAIHPDEKKNKHSFLNRNAEQTKVTNY